MNISIDSPEVVLLRRLAEEKFGLKPQVLNDFMLLSDSVRHITHERLSQSTLERIWQYSTRDKTHASQHSLDVLSRYVGYSDFRDFVQSMADKYHPESDFLAKDVVDVSTLNIGQSMQLSWLPDRQLTVRYLGGNRFEVTESVNSSLLVGDSFECLQIQKGQPLYLDRFCRPEDPSMSGRYVIGKNTGLTTVILNN